MNLSWFYQTPITKGIELMKKHLLFVAMVVALALGSGCALMLVGGAAAAGAGTYAYVAGELRSSEAVPLEKAWSAAQAAVKDMEYAVTEKQKDAASGKLTARGAGDKKITITVEKESAAVTKIRIRVGTLGDKTLSYQILEKIRSHL
jgi:hypothetical protein